MVNVPAKPFELNGVEFAYSPLGGMLGMVRVAVGVALASGDASGLGRMASHQIATKAMTATIASTSGASRLRRGANCWIEIDGCCRVVCAGCSSAGE